MHNMYGDLLVYIPNERSSDGLFMDLIWDFNADANFVGDLLLVFASLRPIALKS